MRLPFYFYNVIYFHLIFRICCYFCYKFSFAVKCEIRDGSVQFIVFVSNKSMKCIVFCWYVFGVFQTDVLHDSHCYSHIHYDIQSFFSNNNSSEKCEGVECPCTDTKLTRKLIRNYFIFNNLYYIIEIVWSFIGFRVPFIVLEFDFLILYGFQPNSKFQIQLKLFHFKSFWISLHI